MIKNALMICLILAWIFPLVALTLGGGQIAYLLVFGLVGSKLVATPIGTIAMVLIMSALLTISERLAR